ncbi:MAG: nucleoside triphosphate pyrophosphohydrolase [Heliobacteriaceae bacterium]|jgi:tetrapyrrole methylase family protein/MazG family protein|nr:nucleoside triphosphate pyrophosphohydrolase [Heliobacteriaceae bacterium]
MENLKELIEVVRVLRSPEGCPWDREQTHESLKPNMLEETYEAIDAIDNNDMKHLKEELGDVLLQVLLHAQIASEEGRFNIEDVAKVLKDKLIYRHPHVFADVSVNNSGEVIQNWEKLKLIEKSHRKSAMDGICKSQPALMSARQISRKAVKKGFEWPNEETLYECIFSEFEEFKTAETHAHKEEELGDILFAIVNLARWNNIDAEQALLKANKKFMERFRKMEILAEALSQKHAAKPLEEYSFEEYDALWKEVKKG